MSKVPPAVEAWIRKAENDFKNIRANLASAEPAWDTVCFHAQQAAEKHLKAYLVLQGDIPPRTHDLGLLLRLAKDFDAALDALNTDCDFLTDYAVEARYPDVIEPDETAARASVAAAERIRDAIRQRLPC
ncbi:MAG: HEPN domain-containing protein [Verrucomicrobia bacterium]|nr:HEPN domain-containing protein [Verrucomicrobiota bacterium]